MRPSQEPSAAGRIQQVSAKVGEEHPSTLTLYVGDDWSEDHHDVHLMNDAGRAARRPAAARRGGGHDRPARSCSPSTPRRSRRVVILGIETTAAPGSGALLAAGYRVYAINPRSASRYRDRHHVGGGKSDSRRCAQVARRPRPHRPPQPPRGRRRQRRGRRAVRILARAHQQLVWDRTRLTNRLRNALREYFPRGPASVSQNLAHGDAVGVLATAPGPREAARLTMYPDSGRAAPRRPQAQRRGARCRAPRGLPSTEQLAVRRHGEPGVRRDHQGGGGPDRRGHQPADRRTRRRNWQPLLSSTRTPASTVPCQGSVSVVLGARVLGEFGDDPERYESGQVPQELRRHLAAHRSIGDASAP